MREEFAEIIIDYFHLRNYISCPEAWDINDKQFVAVGGLRHFGQQGPGPDFDSIDSIAETLEENTILRFPSASHSLTLFVWCL